MCQAIAAYDLGDYGKTVELLLPVLALAHRFGGSNAQRDVIQQTLIEAALRNGQGRLARALANERTALKPSSPYNWSASARALSLVGDNEGADAASRRATALQTTPAQAA